MPALALGTAVLNHITDPPSSLPSIRYRPQLLNNFHIHSQLPIFRVSETDREKKLSIQKKGYSKNWRIPNFSGIRPADSGIQN